MSLACAAHKEINVLHSGDIQVFIKAVLKDDGFQLPTPMAANALEAANNILEWSSRACSKTTLMIFCKTVVQYLRHCLPETCSSAGFETKHFLLLWENFLKTSTSVSPNPILYQFLTDSMLKQLLQTSNPVPLPPVDIQQESLSYEERNALYYAAGFIPRALSKKIQRSNHPRKQDIQLCLAELTDDDGVTDECQDWVNQLDRGGLNHVSSNMYMLIAAMELQLQSLLKQTINQSNSNTMEKATSILMSNDDVLFHWSLTSAAWEADLEQALFPMIVDLWVTMRGFSFVSAWVEQYKTHCKKMVQKSKGIRKHLI